MSSGDDSTLIKVAVFGITVSVVATMMISLLLVPSGNYSMDEINGYRDELGQFTGESMLSSTPWVLTGVYTPWSSNYDTENHIDPDGWLYGDGWQIGDNTAPDSIKTELGKVADIRLDATQKSTIPLAVSDEKETYKFVSGVQWWADNLSNPHIWDSIELIY